MPLTPREFEQLRTAIEAMHAITINSFMTDKEELKKQDERFQRIDGQVTSKYNVIVLISKFVDNGTPEKA